MGVCPWSRVPSPAPWGAHPRSWMLSPGAGYPALHPRVPSSGPGCPDPWVLGSWGAREANTGCSAAPAGCSWLWGVGNLEVLPAVGVGGSQRVKLQHVWHPCAWGGAGTRGPSPLSRAWVAPPSPRAHDGCSFLAVPVCACACMCVCMHTCACMCAHAYLCMHVRTCMCMGVCTCVCMWRCHAGAAGCGAPTQQAAGAGVAAAAGPAAAPVAGERSHAPGGALARISRSLRSGAGRGSGRQPAGARPIRDADSAARLMPSCLEKTAAAHAAPPPPASPRHPTPRWVPRAGVQPRCPASGFLERGGSGWHGDAVPGVPAGH